MPSQVAAGGQLGTEFADVFVRPSRGGSPGIQNQTKDNLYAIGYLDAGHGHDFSLPEVAIANADNVVRTTTASIALGGVAEAGSQGLIQNRFPSSPKADWSQENV